MHGQPIEVLPSEAERIVFAYQLVADGDAWAALVRAVEDALDRIVVASSGSSAACGGVGSWRDPDLKLRPFLRPLRRCR